MHACKKYSTRIESVPCTCIGSPHEHYHMMVGNIAEHSSLTKGNVVTIQKLSDDIYSVSVKGKT